MAQRPRRNVPRTAGARSFLEKLQAPKPARRWPKWSSPWTRYERRSRWHVLRTLGTSPIVRVSILMPVAGYLILLNERVQHLADLAPRYLPGADGTPQRLTFLYFGSFALGVASLIFALRCPGECRKFDTAVAQANAEAAFFTATPAILEGMVLDRMRRRPPGGAYVKPIELDRRFRITSSSLRPFEDRREATFFVMDQFWHMLDPSRTASRIACRFLYDVGTLLLAAPAVVTLRGVLLYVRRTYF